MHDTYEFLFYFTLSKGMLFTLMWNILLGILLMQHTFYYTQWLFIMVFFSNTNNDEFQFASNFAVVGPFFLRCIANIILSV